MSEETPKNFRPEVVFVSEGYEDAESMPATDVVSKRGFISSVIAPGYKGEHPEYHEIIDLQSVVADFLQKLENDGKFNISDESGDIIGTPGQMPEKLANEIYRKTLYKIKKINQSSLFLDETIFELFDAVGCIDATVQNGEIIDISIFLGKINTPNDFGR